MATKIDRKAFMATTNPAAAAKVLGHEDGGRKVRSRLRANGIRVSDGDPFDAKAHNLLWGIFVDGKAAAKAEKAAPKAKKTTTKKAKQEATPATAE